MPLPPPMKYYREGHYLKKDEVRLLKHFCLENGISFTRKREELLRQAVNGKLPTNRHLAYKKLLYHIHNQIMTIPQGVLTCTQ